MSDKTAGSIPGMRMYDANQDYLLVQQCLAGSETAWNEFYSRFVGLIRSVVKRQAGLSPADVQDITQSIFLALTTSLNSYDSGHSLARFVCMVAERILIDEYRRAKAGKRNADTETVDHHDGDGERGRMIPSEMDLQDGQLEKAQLVFHLRGALAALDPGCRELIYLRYYNEFSYSEISTVVGSSENTLTVQTRRCLEKLRTVYKDLESRGTSR
jgi:RNA polymerase sigma-70 factor (ECF subfamily)